MKAIENLRGRSLRIMMTFVCGCAFSLFGYDQALYGGVASGGAFEEHFNYPDASLTGHTAAVYDIGCMIGSIMSAFITQRIGHKKAMLLGSTCIIIGATIQTAAVNIPMLMVGRIIGGIGNGFNTAVSPVYHSETSRGLGRSGAVIGELFILDVGWLVAQFVTLGFSFVDSSAQWRVPTAFQMVYIIPVFLILPYLPDSPRWLASVGRYDEAEEVLARINGDPDSEEVQQSFREIKTAIELERESEQTGIADIWNGKGHNLYRMLLATNTQTMCQVGGINVVAYYIVIIFETQLGLSSLLSRVLAACAGIGWLFSNVASRYFIDTWGRRTLLIGGGIVQAICFLVFSVCIAVGNGEKWAGIVVVACELLAAHLGPACRQERSQSSSKQSRIVSKAKMTRPDSTETENWIPKNLEYERS